MRFGSDVTGTLYVGKYPKGDALPAYFGHTGGKVGGYLPFLACLEHLTIAHASRWRRSKPYGPGRGGEGKGKHA